MTPEIAVIQSGRKSFSGTFLPDQSTISRYLAILPNAVILRTDFQDQTEGLNANSDTDGDHIWIGTDGSWLGAYQFREEGNGPREWELVTEISRE